MDEEPTPPAPSELITPCGRTFKRAITMEDQRRMFGNTLMDGTLRYRGIPFMKFPNDVLIYMRLLHEAKPATVIEIGSMKGGSAVWFDDMIRVTGVKPRIVSIDLKPPKLKRPRISFLEGDALKLGEVLTDELLAELPRPWLVSEDGAHTYATTKAALDFFAPRMRPGEYIVIEDGVLSEGGFFDKHYGGGPNKAIAEFLHERPEFEIDGALCDLFGYNVTGNPNGYLRRKPG